MGVFFHSFYLLLYWRLQPGQSGKKSKDNLIGEEEEEVKLTYLINKLWDCLVENL